MMGAFIPRTDRRIRYGFSVDIQMEVDYNVGRILDALVGLGVAEQTIVILTGDNGAGKEDDDSHTVVAEGGSTWEGGLGNRGEALS